MRDFPVFTTENGVGSLVLREIPYCGAAYITIQSSSNPTDFLNECVDFCRVVGAERIYANGDESLQAFPLYTTVIQMSAPWEIIPESNACLFPVTEQTVSRWKEVYNKRMKDVDNAAYMSDKAAADMLKRGDGYFIHREGELLGIGIASDDRIDCVATVVRGSGREVVGALIQALMCDRVVLDVASTNSRAIRLYESLGFVKTAEISRWYKIFDVSRKNT